MSNIINNTDHIVNLMTINIRKQSVNNKSTVMGHFAAAVSFQVCIFSLSLILLVQAGMCSHFYS